MSLFNEEGGQVDHVSQAEMRLLSQFRDKPNINKILTSYMESVNSAEGMWYELLNERSLEKAVGVQLDIIGKLVILRRTAGLSDEDYRRELQSKIGTNNAEGTGNEVLEFVKNITESSSVDLWEHYPASTIISINPPQLIQPPIETERLMETIDSVHCAGVRCELIHDRYGSSFTPSEVGGFFKTLETSVDISNAPLLRDMESDVNGTGLEKDLEVTNDAFRDNSNLEWKAVLPEDESLTGTPYITPEEGKLACPPELISNTYL